MWNSRFRPDNTKKPTFSRTRSRTVEYIEDVEKQRFPTCTPTSETRKPFRHELRWVRSNDHLGGIEIEEVQSHGVRCCVWSVFIAILYSLLLEDNIICFKTCMEDCENVFPDIWMFITPLKLYILLVQCTILGCLLMSCMHLLAWDGGISIHALVSSEE